MVTNKTLSLEEFKADILMIKLTLKKYQNYKDLLELDEETNESINDILYSLINVKLGRLTSLLECRRSQLSEDQKIDLLNIVLKRRDNEIQTLIKKNNDMKMQIELFRNTIKIISKQQNYKEIEKNEHENTNYNLNTSNISIKTNNRSIISLNPKKYLRTNLSNSPSVTNMNNSSSFRINNTSFDRSLMNPNISTIKTNESKQTSIKLNNTIKEKFIEKYTFKDTNNKQSISTKNIPKSPTRKDVSRDKSRSGNVTPNKSFTNISINEIKEFYPVIPSKKINAFLKQFELNKNKNISPKTTTIDNKIKTNNFTNLIKKQTNKKTSTGSVFNINISLNNIKK